MSLDSNSLENESSDQPFTDEQQDLTQRINQSNDYYEILGVNSTATNAEVKKAYRKMALLLHPDKNQAPGSTDAFKAVGKAFAVLSDSEKRDHYDRYGADYHDSTLRRRRHHSSNSSSSDDYYEEEDAFDPQEIFNMFFGSGFPSENVHVYRRGNTFVYNHQPFRQHPAEHNQHASWFELKTNCIVRDHPHQRSTSNLKVVYYVKPDFNVEYKPGSVSLRRLEDRIESEYVENMRTSCYQERVLKENVKNRGVYFGSQQLLEKARRMRTPSCEKLEKLFNPR